MSLEQFLAKLETAALRRANARRAYVHFTTVEMERRARVGAAGFALEESRLRAAIGRAERDIIDAVHDYFKIASPTSHNTGDNDNDKAEDLDPSLDCLAEADNWQEAIAIIEASQDNGGITRDEAREVVRRRRLLIEECRARALAEVKRCRPAD